MSIVIKDENLAETRSIKYIDIKVGTLFRAKSGYQGNGIWLKVSSELVYSFSQGNTFTTAAADIWYDYKELDAILTVKNANNS